MAKVPMGTSHAKPTRNVSERTDGASVRRKKYLQMEWQPVPHPREEGAFFRRTGLAIEPSSTSTLVHPARVRLADRDLDAHSVARLGERAGPGGVVGTGGVVREIEVEHER